MAFTNHWLEQLAGSSYGLKAIDYVVSADTVSTMASMADVDGMEDVVIMRDLSHVIDLAIEDLLRVKPFKEAFEAAHDMAVFICGSPKRSVPIEKAQLRMGIARPLRNALFSATRFADSILTFEREVALTSAYQAASSFQGGSEPLFAAADFAAFTTHFVMLSAQLPMINVILMLCKPLIPLMARLGSATSYTSSLRNVVLYRMLEHVKPFRQQHSVPGIPVIAAALETALFERLAPVSWFSLAMKPVGVFPLTALQQERRTQEDSILNAAAYLDPACFHLFTNLGGHADDAMATIVALLKRGAVVVSAPSSAGAEAALAAAATQAQLNAAIAKINNSAKPAGSFMSDEAWQEEKSMLVELERKKYLDKRAGLGAFNADPMSPLQEAFVLVSAALRKKHLEAKQAAAQVLECVCVGGTHCKVAACTWMHLFRSRSVPSPLARCTYTYFFLCRIRPCMSSATPSLRTSQAATRSTCATRPPSRFMPLPRARSCACTTTASPMSARTRQWAASTPSTATCPQHL